MQAPTDLLAKRQQKRTEEAAAGERARIANVQRFVAMFLSLGPDVVKIAGTSHDSELAEAKGLAAGRWHRQLEPEQQVVRDEQKLAARPKTRPAEKGDDVLPDRTIGQREAAWLDEGIHRRAALGELKAQAAKERKELESFIVKAR
jgi:hypothetical protein